MAVSSCGGAVIHAQQVSSSSSSRCSSARRYNMNSGSGSSCGRHGGMPMGKWSRKRSRMYSVQGKAGRVVSRAVTRHEMYTCSISRASGGNAIERKMHVGSISKTWRPRRRESRQIDVHVAGEAANAVATSVTSAASPALSTLRAVLGIATIAVIIIQGPQGEGLLRSMNETRAFGTFRQTKTLLSTVTWGLIAAFLLVNLYAALV